MASRKKMTWMVLMALLMLVSDTKLRVHGTSHVSCYFIFGDSLVDSGNNNWAGTLAKVNYLPYGVDYPNGPTGRFCNGRTSVDYIAEFLGFRAHIPSYATVRGYDILRGVNYASGLAGIRNETGQHLGPSTSFSEQLERHRRIVMRIVNILGSRNVTAQYLKRCLYTVGIGTHDYISNYYLSHHYNTSDQFTPEQYAQVLIDQYTEQLKTLYRYGARKVVVTGLSSIGCMPHSVSLYGTNGSLCVDKMNVAAQLFNDNLKVLVYELNKNLTNATFVYTDALQLASVQLDAGSFRSTISNCCPAGITGLCLPFRFTCPNRNDYLFWDSIHPTEAVNYIIARRAYNSSDLTHTYPMNIRDLVRSN